MDRSYIENYHIVDRYLMGKLSAQEQSAFEQAFLDDPDLQDRLDQARAMHAGLGLAEPRLGEKSSTPGGFLGWFGRPPVGLSTAALLVVAVAISAVLYAELRTLRDSRSMLIALAGEVWLEQTRGISVQVRTLPAGRAVILRIDVGPGSAGSYSIDITDDAGGIRSAVDLLANSDNAISVMLPALGEGDYEVTVTANLAGGETALVGRYRIRTEDD